MNNYSNNKLHDPHGFKEVVKIKYDAIKVVTRRFPNGIAAIMALLEAEVPTLIWVDYCTMLPVDQLMREERGDELYKAMLYPVNLKNNNAKKDLHLAYSQRNMTAYSPSIKEMARYPSTQYPNNKPANQSNDKEGDKNMVDGPTFEDKDSNTVDTAGVHVGNTTTTEESTTPSGGASISGHVWKTND